MNNDDIRVEELFGNLNLNIERAEMEALIQQLEDRMH